MLYFLQFSWRKVKLLQGHLEFRVDCKSVNLSWYLHTKAIALILTNKYRNKQTYVIKRKNATVLAQVALKQ